jgi:energy-coupling factor transport system permease protein
MVFCVVLRLTVKIPFNGLKFFKNLTLLAVFIILMQSLFGPGDSYIVKFYAVSLKWEGFILGLIIVCRIAALIIILPVFTETTPLHRIAAGLYALGFNYRIAFIITFVFNLIPFFRQEALSIMDAQKLRGMQSFEKGSFLSRIKTYTGLLVPLMLGAMRKAQVSSVAMDSRAFGIYKKRTWIEFPQMNTCDFWFMAGSIIFFTCILFFNYYGYRLF